MYKASHTFALELPTPTPKFVIRFSWQLIRVPHLIVHWLPHAQPAFQGLLDHKPLFPGHSCGFTLMQNECVSLLAHTKHFQINNFIYPAWQMTSEVPVPAGLMSGGKAASLLLELSWIYVGLKRLNDCSLRLCDCWVLLKEWRSKILLNRKASSTEKEKREYVTQNKTRWTSSLWCHIIFSVCTTYTPSFINHPATCIC